MGHGRRDRSSDDRLQAAPEIETKRVRSRGQWDDLTVRSRKVRSHGAISAGRSPRRDLDGAISQRELNNASALGAVV